MDDLLSGRFGGQWTLALVVTGLLLLFAEAGYRLGRWLYKPEDEGRRSQIGAVQSAVLGILGLLLGFTFSMAVARYDDRRELVLKEANAIGTTWLRASLLPEAHEPIVKGLLNEYVDIRLHTEAAQVDRKATAEGLRRASEIQSKLWQHAEAAAREAPNAMTATFVTSLNELIDTDAERVAAARNRIPGGVWLTLLVVAAVGCCVSAYASGSFTVRSPFTSALLPLLVGVVIVLISDLTHDRQGMIGVSQQPMYDVQRMIRGG